MVLEEDGKVYERDEGLLRKHSVQPCAFAILEQPGGEDQALLSHYKYSVSLGVIQLLWEWG